MESGTAKAGEANVRTYDIFEKPRAFVDPPEIRIGEGTEQLKTVTWKNGTNAAAWLWFPNGRAVFEPKEGEKDFSRPMEIPSGAILNLEVKERPTPGLYHYHLYCEAVKDCAQGNSEPRVRVP